MCLCTLLHSCSLSSFAVFRMHLWFLCAGLPWNNMVHWIYMHCLLSNLHTVPGPKSLLIYIDVVLQLRCWAVWVKILLSIFYMDVKLNSFTLTYACRPLLKTFFQLMRSVNYILVVSGYHLCCKSSHEIISLLNLPQLAVLKNIESNWEWWILSHYIVSHIKTKFGFMWCYAKQRSPSFC